jgi:hypothetical protein
MSQDVLVKLFSHKLPFVVQNKKLEMDYLRFLYLKVVTQDINGTIISPTIDIDEIWHTHLLHNKDYFDMCLNINFLIYHYPERADDMEEVKNQRIDMFKQLYYKHFQILPYEASKINEDMVQIFIKTINGKNITINISLDCSVQQLKQLIFVKEHIATDIQKLVFAGKRIDYDMTKTLREFNIVNHSTIHMMYDFKAC